MEPQEIIGNKFTTFKFNDVPRLSYSKAYSDLEGLEATVLEIHSVHPEFAKCLIIDKQGTSRRYHYPTQLIIEQMKKEEEKKAPINIDELFQDILEKTQFVIK